jgi:16S rRNA A1518/A1519 N6-dimethyltransferase RsmA/KsgA/DIM1 with predicted DNA glycosylase/AP lyase activity
MLFALLFLSIVVILFIFSSKTLSPIPYFPSQPVDIPLIVKTLNLKNDQTVIDLGAGDGIVIFKAAQQSYERKLNTQFVAVEINPILILILHLRRLFHKNKRNIMIVRADIFNMNFNSLTREPVNSITFYLYISPWYLEKTISNIKDQISKFDVVSYMYPLKEKTTFAKASVVKGKNKIFIYQLF